jgi:ribosome recycling factor
MTKLLDRLDEDMRTIRSGAPDATIFDHININVDGMSTTLNQVAQVKVNSPKLVSVSLYDPSHTDVVQAAVRDCGMNLNPTAEKGVVLVPIPKSSKENRDALIKQASGLAENTKVKVRGARKTGMDKLKKLGGGGGGGKKGKKGKKGKGGGDDDDDDAGVSADDLKACEQTIDALTDSKVSQASDLFDAKKAAISEF